MFSELAKKRRSIRSYTDEAVSEEDLKTILETAILSPTAKNVNSRKFVVIRDREMLEKLSKYKKSGAGFLKNANVAIVVLTDKNLAPTTYDQDACITATFIQLQVEDLGLGSCWANVGTAVDDNDIPAEEVIKKLLEIPEHYNVECVIGIGHKNEVPKEKTSLKLQDYVHYEKF